MNQHQHVLWPARCVTDSVCFCAAESLVVIQNHGVQLQQRCHGGRRHVQVRFGSHGGRVALVISSGRFQFLSSDAIRHVIVNEGITMCNVVFYLAFVVTQPAPGVVVAFEVGETSCRSGYTSLVLIVCFAVPSTQDRLTRFCSECGGTYG